MADPIAEFFEQLRHRRRDPWLEKVHGTVRYDLTHGRQTDHWFLEFKGGNVSATQEEGGADCVIQVDKALFGRLIRGETNSIAAWLRNQVKVRGRIYLLRMVERLYAGPPAARDPRQVERTKAPTRREETPVEEAATTVGEKLVSLLDSNTFLVTDARGDIAPSPASPTGFFSFDTRFMSTWQLTVNGKRTRTLSVDNPQHFEARFFLVPGAPTHYVDAKVSIIRQQSLGEGFDEQLIVLNHESKPTSLRVRLEIGSDFADTFEILGAKAKKGRRYARAEEGGLRLVYERESFRRQTLISSTQPAQIDEHGMTFDIRVGPHQEWTTELHVATLGDDGRSLRTSLQGFSDRSRPQMRQELDEWLSRTPTLHSDSEALQTTYQCALVDLAALRHQPLMDSGRLTVAGLPWYMSVFGRDSILTSLQSLPFAPELAAATLPLLAVIQGTELDDFHEEEPGKILHEGRLGEVAAFEEEPSAYHFGASDTTPLFVVLLDEYERWTGDETIVRRFEPEARKCLDWIDTYADALGNGYIWYQRRNIISGLENQCWKDSWNAISFHDGSLPDLPRATCELQGYAYDAKMRAARLARRFWNDPLYADRLEREAAELKARFNTDFWVEDGQYYALALDPDGRQVDALSSNIGHLLWSGIVEPARAEKIAEHLLGPKLFSGWGVRTLATDEARYNPIGYHVGTVWPFDNSFIAWGLRRYGFHEHAAQIAEAMVDAAKFFHGRLPEAFGGYDRQSTRFPVQYPHACSPYALSAGSVLLLLRNMLGLDPEGEHLVVEPHLPEGIKRIELLDIPGRWGRTDAFGRGRA